MPLFGARQLDGESEGLDYESVAREVKSILSRRDCRLISNEEMTSRVTRLLTTGSFTDASRACLYVYAETLYDACVDVKDSKQRQQGWKELYQYLFDIARWYQLPNEERADLANQTLGEIFTKLSERSTWVRFPAAFLAVATQEMRNVFRRWYRDKRANWDSLDKEQTVATVRTPDLCFNDVELHQHIRACFERTMQRYPRARMQLAIVWMKQIEGYNYQDIAAELKMTASHIRVLHARGLDLLRKEPDWRALADEFGLVEFSELAMPSFRINKEKEG